VTLEEDGAITLPVGLEPSMVSRLAAALEKLEGGESVRRRGDVYAVRNLTTLAPEVLEPLSVPQVRSLVGSILGHGFFAVDGILFNKTPRANWKVTWHQDLSIAVRRRADVPGFGPWSTKAGVAHVQPPVSVLENMLALRLHLDDAGEDNGALRVVPGSHRLGRLSAKAIAEITAAGRAKVCAVPAGGIVAMRPLCLHASSSAKQATNRRVVHLVLAAHGLPRPLEWNEAYRV
jgi:ectoine hydroxylase-related dioxygenase (phytanoyl-CoA dioxygenase family)